ncbi:MAG: hypothetical protein Q8K79_12650 [Solirubrobacteraceae bacterium]|nr:hypothetical protein [Solirubrobacteraceae bacterium]
MKSTVAVGAAPPITVAESEMLPPTGTEPDGVVVSAGPANPPAPAQVETRLLSRVTAPVWPYSPPVLVAPVLSVTDALARMLPTKLVAEPRVALLPTCQVMLSLLPGRGAVDEDDGRVARRGQRAAGLEDPRGVRIAAGVERQRAREPDSRLREADDARRHRVAAEVGIGAGLVTRLPGSGGVGGVVVGGGLRGDRVVRVDRPVERAGRKSDDGGAGRDAEVAVDDGRAGVRDRRAGHRREVRGGAEARRDGGGVGGRDDGGAERDRGADGGRPPDQSELPAERSVIRVLMHGAPLS